MLVAVVMMLIPLPTELVDLLITMNIAISVLILLSAIYVTHPLEFSSLPSVILIATLFRLAITITTTRLILLQADAGEIVTAFGTFVVGGSIAVGLVVFFIITVAQFVVIAKGSERVAEVAARFTLDALPGKQMSIDAELRNGDIDQAEARRQRKQLERESQLFGAMDGAMKFVKGDVIAGIVIILVNLIGGFAVGTLQHGMSIGEAAATYSLLTVGDGLVAQIPALLTAIASGTLITRVAGIDERGDLGEQISSQLLRDTRVLTLASVILIGLSLVPGFPTLIFLMLGAILGAGAYGVHRNTKKQEGEQSSAAISREGEIEGEIVSQAQFSASPPATSILVRLGADVGQTASVEELRANGERIRGELLSDLGMDVPTIGVHVDSGLDARRARIDLEGAPIVTIDIPADRMLAIGDPEHLDLLGIAYEETGDPRGRRKAAWVETSHVVTLSEAGIDFLQPADIVAHALERALRAYASHFVGIQETKKLLSQLEAEYADLLREAQEAVPLQKIAEILRRLVAENIPIRNLRIVLESIAQWGRREDDPAVLAEYVRTALKRQISFRAADRNNIIAAYIVRPSTEEALRGALQSSPSGTFLSLPDEDVQSIVGQIEQALSETSADTDPVVLTSMDLRRHLRTLLLQRGIDLPVLSFQELAPEFNVQPLATITLRKDEFRRREPLSVAGPQDDSRLGR